MSVEVLDESGADVDVEGLARLSRFVLDRMRLHPRTEVCLRLVDEDTIAALNQRWMHVPGPTDVLAFPIDEPTLRGDPDEADRDVAELSEGHLGDLALCPGVAARQASEHGSTAAGETDLLTVHGILHLLGYDHADPDGHQEMFGLQDRLLAEWQAVRETRSPEAEGGVS